MDRVDEVRGRSALRQGIGPTTRRVSSTNLPALASGVRLGRLNLPVLLMNLPLSLSTQISQQRVHGRTESERARGVPRSGDCTVSSPVSSRGQRAVVYLLPSTPGLQDQTYVSNLGAVLPHCKEDTVVISRFRSSPRVGEERTGADFFKLMNFTVERPPETFEGEPVFFEGEADLKHIRGNIYIGAHGMRTSRNALTWVAERFDMEIVPFRIVDRYLYHLDCCVLRITEEAVLLCAAVADQKSVRAIERQCEIIDVPLDEARAGITNSLMLPGDILCHSPIDELSKGCPFSTRSKRPSSNASRTSARGSVAPCTSSACRRSSKSGALLSCLIMHVNCLADTLRQEHSPNGS